MNFQKFFKKGGISSLILILVVVGFPHLSLAENGCSQNRTTMTAPKEFLNMVNPVSLDSKNLKAGEALYLGGAKPIACVHCHGEKGDGFSGSDFESTPPARNFTCRKMMGSIPDGQLFWVIKNGSENTSMAAFKDLSETQVWQLIHYIRQFAKLN